MTTSTNGSLVSGAVKVAKVENYTAETTLALVSAYVDDKMSVNDLATKFGRSVRSITAKLSREKVYVKKVYTTKTGASVQKKDATADAIGAVLKMTEAEVESLTKANKTALEKIFSALANSVPLEG